ncbi:MAG: hypothetical protein IVW54_13965 [Candidatus Binataceae bacterium]|nr:hypothetical protein [Candidatus Binataceae bacterium]
MTGLLTGLPGCTPYFNGYAYTTHQTFPAGSPPAQPQPAASPTPSSFDTSSKQANPPPQTHSELSDQLTYYLQGHRLPLVGAQVADAANGSHHVILYGFVATAHGKQDAEDKARSYLNDPKLKIDNRIAIEPELLVSNNSTVAASSAFPSTSGATGSAPGPTPPPQTLQPAQINELLGALMVGMAIVSSLPTAAGSGASTPPVAPPSSTP